jgi:hypothetical protein
MRAALLTCTVTVGLAGVVGLAGGCQTFIGIDDVNGHLPRLDGMYLLGIHRVRTADATDDIVRLRTTAILDREARTLDLSFDILGFGSDTVVGEGSITGIEFPADDAATTFAFNVQVPAAAVAAPPPTGADQTIDVAEMLLTAEAEYSFCAHPADGAENPTFGTVLVAPGAPLPSGPSVDTTCDE